MKQLFTFLFVLTLVLGFSLQTQADLLNRGTDSLGNRLIYDSDLNITWYDYAKGYDYTQPYASWQKQVDWASALTVNFGGNIYDDWRLPITVDAPFVYGYDGTTTGGMNIASSEMGHLFYTELGNKGYLDKSGNLSGCSTSWPYCFTNSGDFQHLIQQNSPGHVFWSSTQYGTGGAWAFDFHAGYQGVGDKVGNSGFAIAVRPGDVPIVPEPISSILFLTGGATLIGRKYIRRKKEV